MPWDYAASQSVCCTQEQRRLPPQDSDAAQVLALEAIPRLREDIEEAQAEVNSAQEQEQLKQIEVAELQRQRNDLRQRMHEAEEAHRAVRYSSCFPSLWQSIRAVQLVFHHLL